MISRKSAETLLPYVLLGAILAAWEALGRLGVVNPVLLPPPSQIIDTIILGIASPQKIGYHIVTHAAHSLALLCLGFAAGVATGIAGGVALGVSTPIYRFFSPLLGFFLPIPAIAWTPVAMVWIGPGAPTIFAIVAAACFSEVVYNTSMGVRAVPKHFVWQASSLGARSGFIFWRILLPTAFPGMLAGIKLGLAASWRSLIGAEMFGGVNWGLGFMLFNAKQFLATDVMFSALLLVAGLSLLLEQGFLRGVERRTVERWGLARPLRA